jgi:hypothetical protein
VKFISKLTNKSVVCSELKVKDYKEILKCTLGDEPDQNIFIETICEVFSSILSKPINQIKQMSIVDALLLILQIRINSQGDTIKIVVTKDDKQMNLELDLNYVLDRILNFYKKNNNLELTSSKVKICFGIPSLEKYSNSIEEEYLYFLDEVTIKNKTINVKTNEEASKLFDALSPKLALQFINLFKDFAVRCKENDYLQKYNVQQNLTFVPSVESLIWYTKLIFSESLDVFYDNLFYLSHLGHLDLNYVESLTPGEYTYMVKKLEFALGQKSSAAPSDAVEQDTDEDFDDSGMFENEN